MRTQSGECFLIIKSYIPSIFCLPKVQTNAFTVIFDEHYSIPMDASMLDEYSLRFAAFGIDADERNISAGVADLKLSDLDLTIRPFNAWLYLQDVNKVSLDMMRCTRCRRVQLGLMLANLISQCWMYGESGSTVIY